MTDEAWKAFLEQMNTTYARLKGQQQTKRPPQLLAAHILFETVYELFLSYPNIVSTTIRYGVLRSIIECYADAHAIFRSDNRDLSAQLYIDSASKAFDHIRIHLPKFFAASKADKIDRPRAFRDLGRWNDKSLVQRVEDVDNGRATVHIYDFLCYFSHISPARHTLSKVVATKKQVRDWTLFYSYATIRKTLESGLFTDDEIKRFDDLESYFDMNGH